MTNLRYTFLTILLVVFPLLQAFGQSKEFKAGTSLEVQSRILRTLDAFYVDSIDVEKLVHSGINAMLRTLDPYTEFIPEKNESDIDMLTTGSYGGVGSVIQKTPQGWILISEPYENTPSAKMGLQPGDTILEVDGVSTQELSVSQASDRMKGVPGSELKLKIKKGRNGVMEDKVLVRERIHVSDVVYYGMVQDSIGYIQIGGFTLYGSKDVKRAFETLKGGGKMKRLIIDLRGNGGGLMSEAIDIVSLFVPKGTMVVSQKGKVPEMNEEFYTTSEPIDTEIPMMVLVNSGSASSSEIVAGALQDLDRAVIAGVRTFGKGLVQNIRPVGYDNSLKLTIAKYYTPSGRCVQAIDYSNRNSDGSVGVVPDSLKKAFKTLKKGRTVYDGGGITPDTLIKAEVYSRPAYSLVANDIFGEYAIEYYKKHPSIAAPSEFALTDAEYEDFVAFASKKEFDSRSAAQAQLDQMLKAAKNEDLYEPYKEAFDALEKSLKISKEEMLRIKKAEFKPLLEEEIVYKYYYTPGRVESIIRNDVQLHKTLDLIK